MTTLVKDPWVDPEDRFNPEARRRWQLLEETGVAEHVRQIRRVGIPMTLEAVVDELIDLRETFGPESCPELLR